MLAEVEDLLTQGLAVSSHDRLAVGSRDLFPHYASCKVDIVVVLRKLCQHVHVVGQLSLGLCLVLRAILVELSHEHTIGCLRVLVGTVGLKVVLHLSATIKLVCGSQVASLHLVEDGLRVDQAAAGEIEVDASTEKLLGKHGNVEMV